jgi:hypothetical protein
MAEVRTTVVTWTGELEGFDDFGRERFGNLLTGEFNDLSTRRMPFTFTVVVREPAAGGIARGGPFTCADAPDVCHLGVYGFSEYKGPGAVTGTLQVAGLTIEFNDGTIYQQLIGDYQVDFKTELVGPVVTPFNSAPIGGVEIHISGPPYTGEGLTWDWHTMTGTLGTPHLQPFLSEGYFFVRDDELGGFASSRLVPIGLDIRTYVPEPSTWALMLLGFGGAGAMLRRRLTATA